VQHALKAKLVVNLPLLRIGENLVGLGTFLELLGCVRIVFVLVWVEFEGGFPVEARVSQLSVRVMTARV
jgi:hypothetical protein